MESLSLESHPSTPLRCLTSTFLTLSRNGLSQTRIQRFSREDIITADVSIENLVIRNLSTFDTKLAHLDLEQLSLALELGIKDLRVNKLVTIAVTVLTLTTAILSFRLWLFDFFLSPQSRTLST